MSESAAPEGAIAIVGMAAHFPGARDVDEFWHNLRTGVESIARFTDEELLAAGVDEALLSDPSYVKANGVLDRMEWFDAGFFGLSPRDAAIMDPQTRHLLECVWHAMEHSGHIPERFDGNIGVFAGAGAAQYFWKNVTQDPELMKSVGYFLLRHTGNDKDFVATRAAYEFNLTGPAIGLQTACSTSLVAVHYACHSLLSYECDMALAGGVTIEQPHLTGYLHQEGEILSPDGHCRSFDHLAGGTVFGSGAGIVALRRLDEAIEDGDTIHAVILGSAVNNDGAGKVSYLAPSVDGQAKAIAEAISIAEIDVETIGLVEAHGTATPVGDPIEVAALTQAFRVHTQDKGFCALGSVKSNIGHTDTAAGVASLIKAALAVRDGVIPPTIHFEKPNPLLELESSPFYVNGEPLPWPEGTAPRRAGVSSLGVGGTNAHVIVQQPPTRPRSGSSRPFQLLTLSGRSSTVLEDATRQLLDFVETHADVDLADVSYTLRTGRRRFKHRRALVCRSAEEAIQTLATGQGAGLTTGATDLDRRDVAFLFAGGGAQYPNMGRELYDAEPTFRTAMQRCLDHIAKETDYDLASLLFPEPADEEPAALELQRPSRALPALFAVQYAQARLWMSWGIEPSAMIGHSMGEYTAACLSGVFSPEDGMSLVYLRGKLFETIDEGGMLSVSLSEADLAGRLGEELSIAALNAPEVSVASGPVHAIEALQERLEAEGVDCRRIRIDVAAHSSMLKPILPEFGEYLRTVEFSPPSIPVISNLTGELAGDELTKPDYWVRHLRETVRFSDGLGGLMAPDGPVLLEVGPGRTLSTVAKMHSDWTQDQPALHSLPHPTERMDALAFQLNSLGALWVHGVDPDWAAFDGDEARLKLPLPGYPFDRQPYFVEPPKHTLLAGAAGAAEVDTGRRSDPADWFFEAAWAASPVGTVRYEDDGPVLVLCRDTGLGEALAAAYEGAGRAIVRVSPGAGFSSLGDGRYSLRPGSRKDWASLFAELKKRGELPSVALHTWCHGPAPDGTEQHDVLQAEAFFAPLYLIHGVEAAEPGHRLRLVAITSDAVAVSEDDRVVPHRGLLQGPIRVAPKEMPALETRLVDIGTESVGSRELVEAVQAEVGAKSDDAIVAYRGSRRFAQRFDPARVDIGDDGAGIREQGVYLITGGLGGIGLVVARELVEGRRAKVVLVSRSGLPAEPDRAAWVAEHGDNDKVSRALREIASLEALGGEVLSLAADVTDQAAMTDVVEKAVARFGALHGVFHAAGTLDDGPLLAKDTAQSTAVLDAKVKGTLALDRALEGVDLDFFMLFSSVSAVIGAPGQIDYAAANAFMDAYASERRSRSDRRVVALAWGAWRDVGMAAELAGEARYDLPADGGAAERVTELQHPVFDIALAGSDGAHAFRTRFTKSRHWMIEEHKVRDGDWVMPGSGYVELIRAAFHEVSPDVDFALGDLVFLRPFRVGEDDARDLEVRLTPKAGSWKVVVRGRGDEGHPWVDHATAAVAVGPGAVPAAEGLPAVTARVGAPVGGERAPHPVMDFGPRWSNITGSSTAGAESLLSHRLPEEFDTDLESATLHPALLDMATAGAPNLVPGVDPDSEFLIPAGYGSLHMAAPLSREMTSHIRLKEGEADGTLASFDVTIYDQTGAVAVVVQDFSMIRVPTSALAHTDEPAQPDWLRNAISPAEGRDVLRRVLTHPTGAHVLVATRPLDVLIEAAAKAGVRPSSGHARRAPARVHLDPVAEALQAHEAVADAAAIGSPDDEDSPRVVAFVVYEPGQHATVSELRRFTRQRVERSFVPQNFVEMVALPRDEDGVVLLGELRDPFAAVDDFIAPRSATEKDIAAIWAELLGLDRVGIHDNFLDVGGHSLVGIRVLLRIQQATGVRLEANDLTLQTLEQLAAAVDRVAGPRGEDDDAAPEADGTEAAAEPEADEPAAEPEAERGLFSRMKKVIAER